MDEILQLLKEMPGLTTSDIVAMSLRSRQEVEDDIWKLWEEGKIQIDPDSTLRLPRKGEKIFRHDYP